jgi:hypothetical protein
MFEFTEAIVIATPAAAVWAQLADVEQWWPPSNPAHIGIDVCADEGGIGVGTPVVFEEHVAGIPGRAEGTITRWVPGTEARWEGTARYRYWGIHFDVREGVSWRIEAQGDEAKLSAHVWAVFPSTLFGRLLEWYATRVLDVVAHDREHARVELRYLQGLIEGSNA